MQHGPRVEKDKRRTPHRKRETLPGTYVPVLVTVCVLAHVWNLRSQRSFAVIKRALAGGADRFGMHVIHFTVQGNHLHFAVEAETTRSLSRAIQGLNIRLAKGLNRMMGRHGKVFRDRFHSSVVRSRASAYRIVRYVTRNYHKHMAQIGKLVSVTFVDPFASLKGLVPLPCAISDMWPDPALFRSG